MTLEEFVHIENLRWRDQKRGRIIKKILSKEENMVFVISPISYTDNFGKRITEDNILSIELVDTPANIFDRLVFSDTDDTIYKDDDYKNQCRDYYMSDIKADLEWYGNVYSKIGVKNRFEINNDSLKQPYGYKVASDVTFEVKETAEIQKVSMKDEQAVGKIVIEKTDKVTGKPIDGVVFEVRDKDGKVLDTLTTDKNGHAESKELPICTYNEDGSFKEDIHYTVVETKAADGYILDETAHDVTLRYDDNAPDVVVTTLKLINVPTEPKLPQTGDNANPLLYLGIGALALITGVGVGLRGRKKKNKQ